MKGLFWASVLKPKAELFDVLLRTEGPDGSVAAVDDLLADLNVLRDDTPIPSEIIIRAIKSGFMVTDSHIPEVLLHQLQVMKAEFCDVDFECLAKDDEIARIHDLVIAEAETPKGIVVPKGFVKLFAKLEELESSFALDVRRSREKDGERGKAIIPDYATVNCVSTDCENDATVKRAILRAQFFGGLVRFDV